MSNLIKGMAWNAAASIASRAAAFGSQIVLGAALAKEDYAVYGVAMSLSALVAAFRNGGTQQVLIQRGYDYAALAPIITYISLLFNIAASLVLILVGWWWARANHLPQLNQVIILMGIAGIVSTHGLVMQAKLAIDHRFKALSFVSGGTGIGRHSLAMLLGLAGMGVWCLSLPIVAESLLTLLLSYVFVRNVPHLQRPTREQFRDILRDTKWLMISSFAVSMVLYGQFMLISLYVDKVNLGEFVFSMQLIQSVGILLMVSISDVHFPRMAKMNHEGASHASFLRYLELSMFLALALSTALAAVAGPVISFVWGAKWHNAILLVQILSALIPATAASTTLCAILAAKSLWRDRTELMFLYLCCDALTIVLFGRTGDLIAICYSFVMMRMLVSLAGSFYVFVWKNENLTRQVITLYMCALPYLGYLTWISWSATKGIVIGMTPLISIGSILVLLFLYRSKSLATRLA